MNWVNVRDFKAPETSVAYLLAVSYVPHTFLLDPNGVILAVDVRGDDLMNMLAEMLP
jgi:hypothetical protein